MQVKDDHSYSSPNPKSEDKLLSPLAESPRFMRATSKNKKYEPSKTMSTFLDNVLPHMLSDTGTHTHPLNESMYGGTLTLGGQEVSLGKLSMAIVIHLLFQYLSCSHSLVVRERIKMLLQTIR